MKHINYYQLFQLILSDYNSDITIHTNNKIIHGIITLTDEIPFNEWYADMLEEMVSHTKLSLSDILKVSSSKLHQSVKSKPISNMSLCRKQYTKEKTIEQINGSNIIDDMLYHTMTLKSSFWDIHEEIILLHFKK